MMVVRDTPHMSVASVTLTHNTALEGDASAPPHPHRSEILVLLLNRIYQIYSSTSMKKVVNLVH